MSLTTATYAADGAGIAIFVSTTTMPVPTPIGPLWLGQPIVTLGLGVTMSGAPLRTSTPFPPGIPNGSAFTTQSLALMPNRTFVLSPPAVRIFD